MKTVLITGTSRGIGAALVKALEAEGHSVLALSRSYPKMYKEGRTTYIPFDITQEADLQQLVAYLQRENIRLDIVVSNAGKLINAPFAAISAKDLQAVYEVNVLGVFRLIQCLLPLLQVQAHIVTISSMGGVQGAMKFAGLSAYTSSKAALIALTELLAEEYKEHMAIIGIAPGFVTTSMGERQFGDNIAVGGNMITKHIGMPEEIATLVAFVAGDITLSGKTIIASADEIL